MSTYYVDNPSSSNQYYFNANNAATSQSTRTYSSSGYSNYPTNQIDNSYQVPQQYQSVAGFNRNTTQQRYQTPQSPAPQVRATVRVVGSQDQYNLPSSSQPVQVSPQQHHFQFDSRQRPGLPTGPAVVYQTPGAAQFTHRNVDLWTEGPSQGQDHYVQVCNQCNYRLHIFFIHRHNEYQFDLFQLVLLNNRIQFLLNDLKIIYNNTTVN
jgi:hypothetical protein